MAHHLDVYAPCPCGSGKKLKFCCLSIAAEMEKVLKLQENHQHRMALQLLDSLEKGHSGNAWIGTTRATILMSERRRDEAKQVLEHVLSANSDHPFATVLYAGVCLVTDGYDAAKPALLRAFQRSAAAYPDLLSGLLVGVAGEMIRTRRYMAARQYLTQAMRLAPEESRQEIFLRLLEFDSNGMAPYPLRSVHHLAEYTGDDATARDAARAARLVDLGCYEPAARLFARLAEQEPDSAALWQNVGLCRAWDGDHRAASEALHKAAQRHTDRSAAVECETLAQLLEQTLPEQRIDLLALEYRVSSVAKLLTRVGDIDRLVRVETDAGHEESDHGHHPAAIYHLLDRTFDETVVPQSIDDVPEIVGVIEVYDAHEGHDHPPLAYASAYRGEPLDSVRELFESAVGDLAEHQGNAEIRDWIGRDLRPLSWQWHLDSDDLSVAGRRDLEQQKWRQMIHEVWTASPQTALAGKSPREAAGDPSLAVPLLAAVYVLDAFCDAHDSTLDLPHVCRELGIEPLPPVEASERLPLSTFSAMQLHRLPVAGLNELQLHYALNRALLIHYDRFLEQVLREVLNRPSCADKVDVNRVYTTLTDLCRDQNRRDEALQWVEKARDHAQRQENSFELVLQWNLRELSLRLEDPQDPQWEPLIRRLMEYYGPKLPEIRGYLETMCDAFGVEPPWETEGVAAGAGSVTQGGIWTPESASSAGGEKKLWIPGLD